MSNEEKPERKHSDKHKSDKKPRQPKPAVGAGSFFEHLETLNGKVEIFDAQIKPLEDSRQGAKDDINNFLTATNIARFVHDVIKKRLESPENNKKYSEILKRIKHAKANVNYVVKKITEKEYYIGDGVSVGMGTTVLVPKSTWLLNDEKGKASPAMPHIIELEVSVLKDMGIDPSKIHKYHDDDEPDGRPFACVIAELDEEGIQSLIDHEANRRLYDIPTARRAKEQIDKLMSTGKELGSEEALTGESNKMLRRVLGQKYDEIREQVYKEALGKARFQKPFDGGLGGDDKEPDLDPAPKPAKSLKPPSSERRAR